MLLGLCLPMLLLSLLAASLWLERLAHDVMHDHQLSLTRAAAPLLRDPANWSSEAALRAALTPLPWARAYLQDREGVRSWTQTRNLPTPAWPRAEELTLPLDHALSLKLLPGPLPDHAQARLRHGLILALLLALIATILLTGLSYLIVARRWQDILNWSAELESGRLSAPAPSHRGLSGGVATALQVIAQRLRFSRDTLQQQQNHSQRRNLNRVRELEQALAQRQTVIEQTRRTLSSRSQIMSGISHELRTPLTAIVGLSELLEQAELPPAQAETAQMIRKSAQSLISMVNDLLDMDRIEAGRLEIHETSFDLSDTVEDTVALLAPLAYEKNLELINIVYHDVPPRLRGDPARTQQILTNLLSNAIKFTPQGHVLIRVSVDSELDERVRVRLAVEDSGPGLDKDQQSRLFQAFERFESADAKPITGSGLGLNIVRRLTELMQGRIEVNSTPGQGSTFSVILPFRQERHGATRFAWDGLRERQCWALEPNDLAWVSLEHLLEFWAVQRRRFNSADELSRTLQHVAAEHLPDFILLGLRADEVRDQAVQDSLGHARQRLIPVACLVNSVDVNLHRELEDWGASRVLAKSSNRTSLYRACCELLDNGGGSTVDRPLQGYRVLVAENNAPSRYYIKTLLNSLGGTPLMAEDGEEALQIWQQERPQLVMLDLNMPRLDGLDATRAIRHEEAADRDNDACVIIGMSAYLDAEQEKTWLDAGLSAVLNKPFDAPQLIRCLHPWLRAGQRQDLPRSAASAQLIRDPELVSMMLEELPKQLDELDAAFVAGELEEARTAAHQLHGTAAFFHLEPLKSHVFLMEKRLRDIDDITLHPRLREDMARVRKTVHSLIDQLRQGQQTAV